MAFIVDIILVLIFALSVFRGVKRGFVKTVFSCFTVVIAIVLAGIFGSSVGSLLKETDLYAGMHQSVKEDISQSLLESAKNTADGKVDEAAENNPLLWSIVRMGADEDEIDDIVAKAVTDSTEDVRDEVSSRLADKALTVFADALGKLIVFLVVMLFGRIIAKVLSLLTKLPFISALDRFGGLGAGIILGFVYIFVLCAAVEILLPYIPENPVVYMGMKNDTLVFRLFSAINPIMHILF